jgi:hypothetical protein
LPPLVHSYKIKSIFDEIVETDKDKILSHFISIHSEDEELIQKNKYEFVFKLIATDKKQFFTIK